MEVHCSGDVGRNLKLEGKNVEIIGVGLRYENLW